MNILLLAATEFEIPGFTKTGITEKKFNGHTVHVLITGVGMVQTMYALMKKNCNQKYDVLIQAGVCGAFDRNLHLGEVVYVASEMFADLGADDNMEFKTVFETGLADANSFPYKNGKMYLQAPELQCLQALKKVYAITVNTVNGNEEKIRRTEKKFRAQTESMEGAAFAYFCSMENLKGIQVRAVSNYVEKRNKQNWKMEEAVANLHNIVHQILTELTS